MIPQKLVQKCIEVRGLKIKVTKPPIPVAYGPAFEGERIRKEDMHIEIGGQRTPAFEWLHMATWTRSRTARSRSWAQMPRPGTRRAARCRSAVVIEVAGRKMQKDFEPMLERKIHHFVNEAQGIWHMGQRDQDWTRVSKAALAEGYASDTSATSSRPAQAQVQQYRGQGPGDPHVDEADVKEKVVEARKAYLERDIRLATMTDESVDTFYSCLLCQSFAPNHVCVITPERLGLCGAYNWLDGKAAYEIDPNGANQPVLKGECLDAVKGRWKGVNEYVYTNSHQTLEYFNAYSIMDAPMTSCGCFECIWPSCPRRTA